MLFLIKKTAISIFALLLIMGMLLAGIGSCTSSSSVPTEVSKNTSDWPLPNRDYANTRATTDSTINAKNVNTLGIAWTFDIPGIGEFGAAPTNPLIIGSKVYFEDMKSNVFALDSNTGEVLWKKEYNMDAFGPEGPAAGWGKIFAIKGHYEIAALDINNGQEIWSTKISDKDTVGVDIQLLAYGNLVYASTVPGSSSSDFYSGGGIGKIYALDQQTGKIKWTWSTIDSADIWGNSQVNSGGGAWYPPAIDTKTGNMYWGIANPAPWPGTKDFPNGSSRPGPNLYTNSMVALNSKTGTLQWYNQVRPHDLNDLDFQSSPILTTAEIKGAKKDIVIGSGKLGIVYAFDRKTGEIYWQTPVGIHQNDNLTTLPEGTTRVYPGVLGGVETPMAVADGILLVPNIDAFGDFTPTGFIGDSFNINAGTGELTALDVNTGNILWNVKLDSMNVGGATIVNDIVFTSTLNGKIYAFNVKTGEQIWTYQAFGGINGWPAVGGNTIIFPVGMGPKPQLIALQVGKATATTTSAQPSSTTTSVPSNTTPTVSTTTATTTLATTTTTPTTRAPTTTTTTAPSTTPVSIIQDGVITEGEYANLKTYDGGNMEVRWSNDGQYVYVAIKAKTTGFVAIGIQPGTTMLNADIIFGYVANGQAQVFDLFSTGEFGPHPKDTDIGGTNDIVAYGGQESGGFTVIEFKRLLNTGDSMDKPLLTGSNQIIWAYGLSDSLDFKHSSRGYGQITIQ